MKQCAFLTLDEQGDFVIDDEHAVAPLEALGWTVAVVSWRQKSVPWSDFDAVIVRSTWDYWEDVKHFLDTLGRIDRATALANPLEIIHWNLEKTYLRDLEGKGVGIVPTIWPGRIRGAQLDDYTEALGSEELVIKPVVGANGEDAYRISPGDDPRRLEQVCRRFAAKPGMVQKFMPAILTEGEFSLFYFNGVYSHAILKIPRGSEFRSQEERGADIVPVRPEALLLRRGEEAMEALSCVPLYARIDFVRDQRDDFVVMEFELIEPSMYLRTDAGAPARFAAAIDDRFSVTRR